MTGTNQTHGTAAARSSRERGTLEAAKNRACFFSMPTNIRTLEMRPTRTLLHGQTCCTYCTHHIASLLRIVSRNGGGGHANAARFAACGKARSF